VASNRRARLITAPNKKDTMDAYEIVNERIIGMLEKGTVPWRCPWDRAEAGIPRNFTRTKPYRGINTFLLYLSGNLKGYRSPFWLTYKQASELGGRVMQGEKSEIVVFFKPSEIENKETGDKETIPLLPIAACSNFSNAQGRENGSGVNSTVEQLTMLMVHVGARESSKNRFYPPSQKATGVKPWMNARWVPAVALAKVGALRPSPSEVGYGRRRSERSALQSVWRGVTAVRPWGSTWSTREF
jgi:hypothetical protein